MKFTICFLHPVTITEQLATMEYNTYTHTYVYLEIQFERKDNMSTVKIVGFEGNLSLALMHANSIQNKNKSFKI